MLSRDHQSARPFFPVNVGIPRRKPPRSEIRSGLSRRLISSSKSDDYGAAARRGKIVPSEDIMSVMKKEQGHTMSEVGRKRKKKQDGVPRPACSWVHFSQTNDPMSSFIREFIKEYTTSHPESSGLKAATKAASDAWKLMTPDEKAKYTSHTREVWDKYLNTYTTPLVPKPRRQTKLVTRCSPGRLLNVLQRLNPEQRTAVNGMRFGSILNLRCRTLRRSLSLVIGTVQHCLTQLGDLR